MGEVQNPMDLLERGTILGEKINIIVDQEPLLSAASALAFTIASILHQAKNKQERDYFKKSTKALVEKYLQILKSEQDKS